MKKIIVFAACFITVLMAVSCKIQPAPANDPFDTATMTPVVSATVTSTITATPTSTRVLTAAKFQEWVYPSASYSGTTMNMICGSFPTPAIPASSPVWVGPYNGGAYNRRTLVRMDISAIPSSAVVVSAVLRLTVSHGVAGTSSTLYGYKLTNSWNETQVDYIERSTGVNWTNQGGDFDAAPATVGTLVFDNDAYTDVEINTIVVQAWVATPADNFGLILRVVDEDSGAHFLQFFTDKDYAVNRPLLTVQYYLP